MRHSRAPRRQVAAIAVAVAAVLGTGACGGDQPSGSGSGDGGSTSDALDGDALRAAVTQDAEQVDAQTRAVAPVLADAVGGRVLGAFGGVEGCQGGSFEGSTAYGYQVRGRLVGFSAGGIDDRARELAAGLEQAGWSGVEQTSNVPGRVGVGAEDGGVALDVLLDDDVPGATFTVRGRCLPVTDEGREAARGLIEPREVIAKR